MQNFKNTLTQHQVTLHRSVTEILQVNVGKLCNLACHHCHVEASPKRTEIMNEETAKRVIELLMHSPSIHTVDLTGGAPELNSHFKYLITESRKLGKKVIDRCNLTILFEKGQEETAQFLADNQVEIVASLPCYSKSNVEKQRGNGVFDKSIEALKMLNSLGYGKVGTGLLLNLVYNPGGAFLPPAQGKLEVDYKRELKEFFNIEFNNLYTITNMPIKRFLYDLERQNKLQDYMQLLITNFNPHSAENIMYRNLVSIAHDGELFDCDFNQMLELPLNYKKRNIWDIESYNNIDNTEIAFANHCYGCTAGAGSSCGGSIA